MERRPLQATLVHTEFPLSCFFAFVFGFVSIPVYSSCFGAFEFWQCLWICFVSEYVWIWGALMHEVIGFPIEKPTIDESHRFAN